MNIYVVVEGRVVEKIVYTHWVPYVNSALSCVPALADVVDNHFIVVSGGGYPNYLRVIEDAVQDMKDNLNFQRLVIAVDSEEMTYEEKHKEIDDFVQSLNPTFDYRIVVQHFCFETWALGNKAIGSRNPKNAQLQQYRRLHDVTRFDPELLPEHSEEELTRAQFAEKYLRLMLNDKNKNLTYSKSKPEVVVHPKYFEQVSRRLRETNHIGSFQYFLSAFA